MTRHPSYRYILKNNALWQIESFYLHVSLKYRHTYSYEDMERNVKQAVFDAYQIEQSLLRCKATVKHWQQKGWNMAKAGKWYYAYTIEDDTVIIEDACHEQNMYDTN